MRNGADLCSANQTPGLMVLTLCVKVELESETTERILLRLQFRRWKLVRNPTLVVRVILLVCYNTSGLSINN